jgi:hypothetical protein
VRTTPLLIALCASMPAAALANGAFPDTGQVLLPGDLPRTIVVGTNFGLVVSDDGGGHWRWTCEHGASLGGYRYALGADQRRVVGNAGRDLITTVDLGCTWSTVSLGEDIIPFDFFPEGRDPAFVLALAESLSTRIDTVTRVDVRAPDGAPQVLFRAPMDEQLTTVESARSDPRTIYATLAPLARGARTRLARSADAGQTWTVVEPAGAPQSVDLRIAAVDPGNPARLYFRASTVQGNGEALVLSEDGGATLREVFTTTGSLAALLPLAGGGWLLAALENNVGSLLRDDGAGFVLLPQAHMHVRGLAERGGLLYVAADDAVDGFALGLSRDRGATWERAMAFADIGAITGCGELPAACVTACGQLVTLGVLQPPLCRLPEADAGAGADARAGADAGAAGAGTGCSCRYERPGQPVALVLAWLVALGLRRGRGGRRPS